MTPAIRSALTAAVFAVSGVAFAGTVDVAWVKAGHCEDAGTSAWDEQDNMKALGNYMQLLGRKYLPDGQTLRVEVLDLDMAGTVEPSHRDATPRRVVRGRADYPRINMRYSLLDGSGHVIRNGEEWVVDMNYTRGIRTADRSSDLYFEKHMLEGWFRQRFVEQQASVTH